MRALAAGAGAWMAVRKKINTKQRPCKAIPHYLWPKYYGYKQAAIAEVPLGAPHAAFACGDFANERPRSPNRSSTSLPAGRAVQQSLFESIAQPLPF
jgi:hypothetical protein